jgi:hypothetical protein
MKISEATADEAMMVAARMRDRDALEFFAVSGCASMGHMKRAAAERAIATRALCASHNDIPVGIGGLVETRPGVASLLFFATEDFSKIVIDLTRFVSKELIPAGKDMGFHRIECVSHELHTDAHRWIKQLGLTEEAVLQGFGRGGETFILFSWVAERVRQTRH